MLLHRYTESMGEFLKTVEQFVHPSGHRYALLQPTDWCNFATVCKDYCQIPSLHNPATEQTLADTKRYTDWLRENDFRVVGLYGGELLANDARFKSKEGLTPYQHTIETVKHMKESGMTVGIVSNGSLIKEDYMIPELAEAGLDSLTFSYHIHTRGQLDRLVELGTQTGEAGIIPTITMVFTNKSGKIIPAVAAYVVEHGIPFATGLVQEFGNTEGLSTKNENTLLPTPEEQEETFRPLRWLSKFGMVRTSSGYMRGDKEVNRNRWTCDPAKDNFIKISPKGTLYRCHEKPTNISVDDIDSLSEPLWRDAVKQIVEGDGSGNPCQCGYECFFQAENFNLIDYSRFAFIGLLYKTGHADVARWLGRRAVAVSKKFEPNTDWELRLK